MATTLSDKITNLNRDNAHRLFLGSSSAAPPSLARKCRKADQQNRLCDVARERRTGQGGIRAVAHDALARLRVRYTRPPNFFLVQITDNVSFGGSELEGAFARHSLRMVLQAFSACAAALSQDIAHLLQTPPGESSWRSHPTHTALLASPPPALSAYTARLRKLANADRLPLLLVHAFVRHLGDVRGGLALHDKLSGVYGSDDGQGVQFLDFRAAKSDAAQLQRWYEDQLNDVVGDSREQKSKRIYRDRTTAYFSTEYPSPQL